MFDADLADHGDRLGERCHGFLLYVPNADVEPGCQVSARSWLQPESHSKLNEICSIDKVKRATAIRHNYEEGEKFVHHRLREMTKGKPQGIFSSLNIAMSKPEPTTKEH